MLLERVHGVIVRVEGVVELAGHEDVFAVQTRLANGLADALLVAVHLRGVDVAVADLEGLQRRILRLGRRNLEDAETELRNLDAVVQCDGGHSGHGFHANRFARR